MPSRLLAAALAACALSGCCLVMEGTSQEVLFSSEPPGAKFDLLGHTHTTGADPLKLDVPLKDYTIVFKLAEHDDASIDLTRQLNSWFFLSIVGGVAPALIDIATGSWYEFALKDEQGVTRVHAILKRSETKIIETLIESVPPGATVKIDGKTQLLKTPLTVPLEWAPGSLEKFIYFSLPHYKDFTFKATRPAGDKPEPVRVDLVPDPQYMPVAVSSEPPAGIWWNDKLLDVKNGHVTIMWLPNEEQHTLIFRASGFEDKEVFVRRGTAKIPHVKLEATVTDVQVKLVLDPPAAEVEFEGNVLTPVDGILALRWVSTRERAVLRVSHPGYQPADVIIRKSDVLPPTAGRAFQPPAVKLTPRAPKAP